MVEQQPPTPEERIEAREILLKIGLPLPGEVTPSNISRIRHHRRSGKSNAASAAQVIIEESESIAKGLTQKDLSHRRLVPYGPLALGLIRTFVVGLYRTPAQSIVTAEEVIRTGRPVISPEEERVLSALNQQIDRSVNVAQEQLKLGNHLVETMDPRQVVDIVTDQVTQEIRNDRGDHFFNVVMEEFLQSGKRRFHDLYEAAAQLPK